MTDGRQAPRVLNRPCSPLFDVKNPTEVGLTEAVLAQSTRDPPPHRTDAAGCRVVLRNGSDTTGSGIACAACCTPRWTRNLVGDQKPMKGTSTDLRKRRFVQRTRRWNNALRVAGRLRVCSHIARLDGGQRVSVGNLSSLVRCRLTSPTAKASLETGECWTHGNRATDFSSGERTGARQRGTRAAQRGRPGLDQVGGAAFRLLPRGAASSVLTAHLSTFGGGQPLSE
jgi:hypothetical protein